MPADGVINLAWISIYAVTMVGVLALRPERLHRGRLLTRSLWRLLRLREPSEPYARWMAQLFFRLGQVVSVTIVLAPFVQGNFASHYFPVITVLYLDDYLTGDDDSWKRKWQALRNKARWLMKLPQPATESGTA